ncbi:MAG TPA: hypothetical protein VF441_10745 [Acidimicrobiia bacterium]
MKCKRSFVAAAAAAAVLGSVAVAGSASAAVEPGAAKTAKAAACSDTWPASVQGRPIGLNAGDTGGVYLWHDGSGWHLRVTHKGDHEHSFTGAIATKGNLAVRRVADEQADKAGVTGGGHALWFRFQNYGRMDGIDFRSTCAPSIHIELRGDGHNLPASRVFVGRNDTHPANVPFTIARTS